MKKNKSKRYIILAFVLIFVYPLFAQKKSAVELFKIGQDLQSQSKWYDAIDAYQEALEQNPQYGDVLYNLAVCHYALESYDLSVQYAEQAAKYARDLSDINNLKGLALISLGKIEEARKAFESVQKNYPNDVNSRFGLAELDLLEGRISVAESRYIDALKRDESNRKALLSLALVSAEMGKTEVSENYIKQALLYYSGEPEVHYMAAYLAAKRGDYKTAETRIRSAVAINGNFDKAYALLAAILYEQNRYEEVLDISDFRVGRDRNNVDAWYLKALSLQKLGKSEDAIDAFEQGLAINPNDEIMRCALEQLVNQVLPLEDERRTTWAQFHSQKAKEFARTFDGISERYEYQKSLAIAPFDISVRQSFADMLERDGNYELYLQQLKFIKENEDSFTQSSIQQDENSPKAKRTKQQIKNDDAIESYESLLRDSIALKWNVDPFYLDKTRWNIGIYWTKSPIQLFHADIESITARAINDSFNGVPSTSVDVQTNPITTFGDAFRLARESGRDYFVVLTAKETERTYSIDAQIYSARTGTKTSEIHVYRTGNDRVAKSLQRFRQGVLDILPIRGKVIRNAQGQLLLDLGKNDGVVEECEFDIVRKGCIITKDSGPGITYNKKDFLGTVKITASNEEISEGQYKKNGFYDTLNEGDEVLLTKKPTVKKADEVQDTRPAADNNGDPVTEEARRIEREALKESLRPATRENDLLHLIRTIL